jgi:hypothetical protein
MTTSIPEQVLPTTIAAIGPFGKAGHLVRTAIGAADHQGGGRRARRFLDARRPGARHGQGDLRHLNLDDGHHRSLQERRIPGYA